MKIEVKQQLDISNSIDELNFCEFPLAVLDQKKRMQAITFTDEIKNPLTGEKIQRSWTLTGLFDIGLPTMDDEIIYHGLQHFAYEQGLHKGLKIDVTYRTIEMLHLVGWPLDGLHYEKHDLALLRLFSVSIICKNAFYDAEEKRFLPVMEGLRIIERFRIYGQVTRNHSLLKEYHWEYPWNSVWFTDAFLKSLKNKYYKRFNLEFYRSLERPIARRVYQYVDKYFNNEKYRVIEDNKIKISFELKDFAYNHIGISLSKKYDTMIKQQLEPSLNELIQKGYLLDFYYKEENGVDWIVLVRTAEFDIRYQAEQAVQYFKQQANSETGISENEIQTAIRLIKETCYDVVKYIVDYAIEQAQKTNFRMKNFQAILKYKDEALKALEEEKTAKAKKIREMQRKEQERREYERQQEIHNRYMKYFFSLPPSERDKLTRQAVEELRKKGIKEEHLVQPLIEWQIIEILQQKGVTP